jgi:protein-disulfide isomerase
MTEPEPIFHLMPPVYTQDHCQGKEGATLVLVEYGDYRCQHCAQVYPLLQLIQAQFPDVRFVFRHFPSPELHPFAQHAAEAAEAAGAQGKFWEMHDRLMRHSGFLDDASLIEHAIALNLDINRFLHEMSTDIHVAHVLSDYESGIKSGVSCTPTFFINGLRFIGDCQSDALQTSIAEQVSFCGHLNSDLGIA